MQERLLTETREMAAKDVVKEEFSASNKAPYDTLLKEFQETRQQLAEARVHIDRLRFGANFTIDHCFELLFKHQFASPQPTGSTCSLPKQAWTSSCQEGGISAVDVLNALSSKQPAVTVGMEDAGTSPIPRGDALNHIRELRDQVNTVASTINDSNASPEEQCDQLTALQLEHQKMIKDIGSFLHEGEDEKKTLLQEELTGFADQLRELNNDLRRKALELPVDNDKVQHLPVMDSSHEVSEAALPQCYFIESGSRVGYGSSLAASQSLESSSCSQTSPSPLPSSPSISPPPPSSRMADKDRIAQVQRRLSMQTRAFNLTSPQPVLSSSISSSMSSSLAENRSRERPKRKKRLNLPLRSEPHTDPSLLNCSDTRNISTKHKDRNNHKSKIPLRLLHSPMTPSHYLPYAANQAPLWQDSVVVDSGFGGSPYGHLNHWQGMSPCNTSMHSLSTEEQDDRLYSNNLAMPEEMERDNMITRQQLSNSADDSSSFQQQQQKLHDAHLSPSSETSQVGDTSFLSFRDHLTSTPTNTLHIPNNPFCHATPSNCTAVISPEQYISDTHSTPSSPTNNLPFTANSSTNTSTSANIPALQLQSQLHTLSYPHATAQQPYYTVQSVGTQPSLVHASAYSRSDQATIPLSSNDHSTSTAAHGHRSSRIPIISRNSQLQTPFSCQHISPSQDQDSAVNSELHPSQNINSDPRTRYNTLSTPATIPGHHRPSRIPLPKYAHQSQFSRSPSPSRPTNTSPLPSPRPTNTSSHSPSRPTNTSSHSPPSRIPKYAHPSQFSRSPSRPISTSPLPSPQPTNTSPHSPSQFINTSPQSSSSRIPKYAHPSQLSRSPSQPISTSPLPSPRPTNTSPQSPPSRIPKYTHPSQFEFSRSPSQPISTSPLPSPQPTNTSPQSPSRPYNSPSSRIPLHKYAHHQSQFSRCSSPSRPTNTSPLPSPQPISTSPQSPSRPYNTSPRSPSSRIQLPKYAHPSQFSRSPSPSRPISTSPLLSPQPTNTSPQSPSRPYNSPSSRIPLPKYAHQSQFSRSSSPSRPTNTSPQSPSQPYNTSPHSPPSRIPKYAHLSQFSRSPSPSRPVSKSPHPPSRPINASPHPPSWPFNTSRIPISNQRRDRSPNSRSPTSSTPLEDRCTKHPPTIQADEHFPLQRTKRKVPPVSEENYSTPLEPDPSSHPSVDQAHLPAHSHHQRLSRIPIQKYYHLGNTQQNCNPSQSNTLDGNYEHLIQTVPSHTKAHSFPTAPVKDGLANRSPQPIHPFFQDDQYIDHQQAAQNSYPVSQTSPFVFTTKPTKQRQHRSPHIQFESSPKQYNARDYDTLHIDSYSQQRKIPTHRNTPQSTSPGVQNHQKDISSSMPLHNRFDTPHSLLSNSQNHQQPAQIDSPFLQNQCTAGSIKYSTPPPKSRNNQNLRTSHDSQTCKDPSPSHDNLMPPQTSCPLDYIHSAADDNYLRNYCSTPQSVTESHVPLEHLSNTQQQENRSLHHQPGVSPMQYFIPSHDQAVPSRANTQFSSFLPHTMQRTDHQSIPNPVTSAHQDSAQINLPSNSDNPYHHHHAVSCPQTHSSPASCTDPHLYSALPSLYVTSPANYTDPKNRLLPLAAAKQPYSHRSPLDSPPSSQYVQEYSSKNSPLHFTAKLSIDDQHSNSRSLPSRVYTPYYSSSNLTKTAPPPIQHAKATQTASLSYHNHSSSYSTGQPSTLPYTTLKRPSPQLKTHSNYKPQNSSQRRQLIEHDRSGYSERESYDTDDSSLYGTSQRTTDTHKNKQKFTESDNSEERGYSDSYTDSATDSVTDSSVTVTPHTITKTGNIHKEEQQHFNHGYRDHCKQPSFHKNRKRAVKTVTQPILLRIHPKVVIKEAQRPVRATVIYDSASVSDQESCMVYRNQVVVKPSHNYVPTRLEASQRYYTTQRRDAGKRGIQCAEEIKRNDIQIDDDETVNLTKAQELAEKLKRRSKRMNKTLVHNLALL